MMKYLILLFCLAGGAMAAESTISTQTELYIVAGILGGACLLLTIASIFNAVSIIGLQSKVAVLQAAGSATVKAVATAVENSPPQGRKFPDPEQQQPAYASISRSRKSPAPEQPAYTSLPRSRDPYESRSQRPDPYRRPESRGEYKMERLNSHYDDHRHSYKVYGGQPSKPHQDDRRPPSGYYY